jgi:hypothetical protein
VESIIMELESLGLASELAKIAARLLGSEFLVENFFGLLTSTHQFGATAISMFDYCTARSRKSLLSIISNSDTGFAWHSTKDVSYVHEVGGPAGTSRSKFYDVQPYFTTRKDEKSAAKKGKFGVDGSEAMWRTHEQDFIWFQTESGIKAKQQHLKATDNYRLKQGEALKFPTILAAPQEGLINLRDLHSASSAVLESNQSLSSTDAGNSNTLNVGDVFATPAEHGYYGKDGEGEGQAPQSFWLVRSLQERVIGEFTGNIQIKGVFMNRVDPTMLRWNADIPDEAYAYVDEGMAITLSLRNLIKAEDGFPFVFRLQTTYVELDGEQTPVWIISGHDCSDLERAIRP